MLWAGSYQVFHLEICNECFIETIDHFRMVKPSGKLGAKAQKSKTLPKLTSKKLDADKQHGGSQTEKLQTQARVSTRSASRKRKTDDENDLVADDRKSNESKRSKAADKPKTDKVTKGRSTLDSPSTSTTG